MPWHGLDIKDNVVDSLTWRVTGPVVRVEEEWGRTPAGRVPVSRGRQAEVTAVPVEGKAEVGVVRLAEGMVDLHHHGQVDAVGGADHSQVGPSELVRLVDGVSVPL